MREREREREDGNEVGKVWSQNRAKGLPKEATKTPRAYGLQPAHPVDRGCLFTLFSYQIMMRG